MMLGGGEACVWSCCIFILFDYTRFLRLVMLLSEMHRATDDIVPLTDRTIFARDAQPCLPALRDYMLV